MNAYDFAFFKGRYEDANVQRVNLISFVNTLKDLLKGHPDHIITFLQVDDRKYLF